MSEIHNDFMIQSFLQKPRYALLHTFMRTGRNKIIHISQAFVSNALAGLEHIHLPPSGPDRGLSTLRSSDCNESNKSRASFSFSIVKPSPIRNYERVPAALNPNLANCSLPFPLQLYQALCTCDQTERARGSWKEKMKGNAAVLTRSDARRASWREIGAKAMRISYHINLFFRIRGKTLFGEI